MEATIHKLINTEARYIIPDQARATGISISKVHFEKNGFMLERFEQAGYHIFLSDDQKRACVTYAKKMLKISSNFDKNKFANAFTGDEPGFNFMNHREKLERKFGQ